MKESLSSGDPAGLEALNVIANQDAFNRWMFETISPFCSGHILEIGSGIGNISTFFLEYGFDLTLSDLRPEYIGYLKAHFNGRVAPEQIIALDLVHPHFSQQYQAHLQQFDSLFALNVIEHIADEHTALKNAAQLLKTGGTMVILVPAYFALYNHFDHALGHFRRYHHHTLARALRRSGLNVKKCFYFNVAGMPGWWLSGKLQGNRNIPQDQMNLFNRLVPVLKVLDHLLLHKTGLSVIGIAEKEGD